MFLGTAIKRTSLNARGISVMVAWTIWIMLFILILELAQKKFNRDQISFSLNSMNLFGL